MKQCRSPYFPILAVASTLITLSYFPSAAAMGGERDGPAQTEAANNNETLAEEIGDAWMFKTAPQNMAWNWKEAVLAIGLQSIHQRTQDPEILDYLQSWVDWHIARGYRINRSDTVVPATTALYLWSELGDDIYLQPVEDCHFYLDEQAPRLDDGSLAHTAATPNQIWMDSLFMLGTFYTFDATITGNDGSFDDIAEQFNLFQGHLKSPGYKLYWHMYQESTDSHVPVTPTFWGRGNGWVLASLSMLLDDLPTNHFSRPELEEQFAEHAAAIMSHQSDSGLWHTVINQNDTYEETSATALFAFGLLRGYRLGLLGEGALQSGQRAIEALLGQITYDEAGYPVVTGISKATNPGPSVYYANIPTGDDEAYGVGAVLLALEEASALGL